jgi:hypothetical protein
MGEKKEEQLNRVASEMSQRMLERVDHAEVTT